MDYYKFKYVFEIFEVIVFFVIIVFYNNVVRIVFWDIDLVFIIIYVLYIEDDDIVVFIVIFVGILIYGYEKLDFIDFIFIMYLCMFDDELLFRD